MLRALILASLLLAGCTKAIVEPQVRQLAGLDKEHFYSTVTTKDGELDTSAILSTENGWQLKQGLIGIVWDDSFIRAFIDKSTGFVRFQVYTISYYGGKGIRISRLTQ